MTERTRILKRNSLEIVSNENVNSSVKSELQEDTQTAFKNKIAVPPPLKIKQRNSIFDNGSYGQGSLDSLTKAYIPGGIPLDYPWEITKENSEREDVEDTTVNSLQVTDPDATLNVDIRDLHQESLGIATISSATVVQQNSKISGLTKVPRIDHSTFFKSTRTMGTWVDKESRTGLAIDDFESSEEDDEDDINVFESGGAEAYEMEDLEFAKPRIPPCHNTSGQPGCLVVKTFFEPCGPFLSKKTTPLDLSRLGVEKNCEAVPFFCSYDDVLSEDVMKLITILDHEFSTIGKEELSDKNQNVPVFKKILKWSKRLFTPSEKMQSWETMLSNAEEGKVDLQKLKELRDCQAQGKQIINTEMLPEPKTVSDELYEALGAQISDVEYITNTIGKRKYNFLLTEDTALANSLSLKS